MPPQSPARGVVTGLLLVTPPTVASLYDVKFTWWPAWSRPGTAGRLPWFWTNSEAFWDLSVEPAAKTSVVSNGTEALPSLIVAFDAGRRLEHEGLLGRPCR